MALLDIPHLSSVPTAGPAGCTCTAGEHVDAGTYDPDLNTIYWGTSNPAPDFEGSVRPGDDLYTDCVLAVDPDTGRLNGISS